MAATWFLAFYELHPTMMCLHGLLSPSVGLCFMVCMGLSLPEGSSSSSSLGFCSLFTYQASDGCDGLETCSGFTPASRPMTPHLTTIRIKWWLTFWRGAQTLTSPYFLHTIVYKTSQSSTWSFTHANSHTEFYRVLTEALTVSSKIMSVCISPCNDINLFFLV